MLNNIKTRINPETNKEEIWMQLSPKHKGFWLARTYFCERCKPFKEEY